MELQEGNQGLAFLSHKPWYSLEPEHIIPGEHPQWKGTGQSKYKLGYV